MSAPDDLRRAARSVEAADLDGHFEGLAGAQAVARRMAGDYRHGFADGLAFAAAAVDGSREPDRAVVAMATAFLQRRDAELSYEPY